MNATLLSIGDELVLGQTQDTNSRWLAQQLSAMGCDVLSHHTEADDQGAIGVAIRAQAARSDVLLISGGLGPTDDDLTRQALSDALGKPLIENPAWIEELQKFFHKLGRTMPDRNRVQAQIPEGAEMIWNHHGTAPGIRAQLGACAVFVMPGVPKEMKPMFEASVRPYIAEKSGGAVILQKMLHTFGVGESTVAERLGDLMQRGRNPSVGTTVANGVVSLRINARFDSLKTATKEMEKTIAACRKKLTFAIYGEDEETLPQLAARLLKAKGQTVATAESCTGGLLAKYLTDIPGSSAYFKQGWITYTNESKSSQLDIDPGYIHAAGAVSELVVIEMAKGALKASGADVALAISGIAGPDGGTPDKPVGTVCIGMAFRHPNRGVVEFLETNARRFVFTGDREMVRDRSAKMALTMLRFHLLDMAWPF